MDESVNSEKAIRDYLLGRVSDETTREGFEDRLFTDEEFCSLVALTEDGLLNDYVLGRLNNADAASLQSTLANNPDRRLKLDLTEALRKKALARDIKTSEARPSFFASLQSFFRQPKYVAAFAVLLVAVLISVVYFSRRGNPDELAELRLIYQQARPTETRISQFPYAPLTQLRGAPEAGDRNRFRRIENNLIEAAEKKPNAQNHYALGVFYLTQQDYAKAIKEFESALKFADDAKIHNDLGSTYFERAKTKQKEKRPEDLVQSLEEFTIATKLDPNLLEALFNKSLALQELGMSREAKESWLLYLQKDPSSRWADEARKNLGRIETAPLSKSNEQVLSDFLTAYRNQDNGAAQKIHDDTKGLLRDPAVALQLSRRYLIAKQRGDETDARESLDAMAFIGRFEQAEHSEFFFLN
jgi:tetratricopeptide (TPR) repeat protein